MSDQNPLADPEVTDLSRFIEDGEGFTLVEEGDGDLPVYDWDQRQEEIITDEGEQHGE